ncbi:hypothetical protein J4204_03600 [Candidatus Woesearchaeota archaeon]|nr:hypothetical protein [Candidatus Woesearchaeota archaeon]
MKQTTKAHLGMISGILFFFIGFAFPLLWIFAILMIVFSVITYSKAKKQT